MPPRRISAAAASVPAAAAAAAPSLSDLPDELLLRVLEYVPQEDRFRRVAPVSRRLRALCLAPQLLRTLKFDSSEDDERQLQRLESLLVVLQCHAQHVRSLDLDAELQEDDDCKLAVAACLGACGSTARLEHLRLANIQSVRMSWLCGLTSLRSLLISALGPYIHVHLGQSSRLTALQDLHLSGALVCPGPATQPCLPPSLTSLCIHGELDDADRELPPQLLLGLTGLQSLTLKESNYTSSSLALMSALTALTCLRLEDMGPFPVGSSLSLLSSLHQLQIASCVAPEDDLDSIVAALPALTSLALHLGFPIGAGSVIGVPPSATALRNLRGFSFSTYQEGPVNTALPGGPWLAQLRWLGLPWQMAVPAAATLATAAQLQHLCLFALPPYELSSNQGVTAAQWAAFWRIVHAHAPLRSLFYEVKSSNEVHLCSVFLDGLHELQCRRPQLRVARIEHTPCTRFLFARGTSRFWELMLGANIV